MDKQQFEDLVLGAIDGTNSPSDQAELDAHCAGNPEDEQIYQNMVRTAHTLDLRVPAEAPRHFANNVMREVRARAAAQTVRPQTSRDSIGIFDRIAGWLTVPRVLATVGATAVVAFAAIMYVSNPTGVDSNHAVGTMLRTDSVAGWKDIDRQEITLAGVTGTASLRRSGDQVAVVVDYRADQPCIVTLSFDRNAIIPIDVPSGAHSAPGAVIMESTVAQAVSTFKIASDAQSDITVTVTMGNRQQIIELSPLSLSK